MVLSLLLLFALLVERFKGPWEWGTSIGSFLLVQLIRASTTGSILPAGTGGTQVAGTFSIGDTIRYALCQTAYAFGTNVGPEHLNGCPRNQSPLGIRLLVLAAGLAIVILVIGLLVKLIRDKRRDARLRIIWNSVLFLLSIETCIASSSVTIRAEMCWVYISLTASLLFLAYMYGVLTQGVKPKLYPERLWPWGVVSACHVALMLSMELFYKGYYSKLYLWSSQFRYNSLVEETYERYGDSIFGKTVYIIGDNYEMSDLTARTFSKVHDKDRIAEGIRVEFIDSIRDVGPVNDRMLVLWEDPDHDGLQDITQFAKELKLQVDYGYYEDGWMDEHVSLTVMAGETGRVDLETMYPGVMDGGKGTKITMDQGEPRVTPIHSAVANTIIEAEP